MILLLFAFLSSLLMGLCVALLGLLILQAISRPSAIAVGQGGYSKCPACGYWAYTGRQCYDCGYRG